MSHDEIDPLDAQDPVRRANQRFRINLAAGLLLDWVLTDTQASRPDYFAELETRLETGFEYARMWKEEGTFDGSVPVHSSDYSDVDFWIDLDDLRLLLDQLFPHGSRNAASFDDGRALVVVVLQSALETLFQDLSLRKHGDESVVAAVARILGLGESDPKLDADLVDLRETRNLIAHHSGCVTERYRRYVPLTSYNLGETRIVSASDISRFASAVRVAGQALMSRP